MITAPEKTHSLEVKDINYQSIESIDKSTRAVSTFVQILLLLPLIGFICYIALDTLTGNQMFLVYGFMFAFFGYTLVATVLAVYWVFQSLFSKKSINSIAGFAADNNLGYKDSVDYVTDQKPGALFAIGSNKSIRNVITGHIQDLPFELYNYAYSVSKKEYRYTAAVAEITLPRLMPNIVIDSLVEQTGVSVLPINFRPGQKIELEGDFHKYFSVYAPDDFGVTALTILSPDVMQALMDSGAQCDIELIDNKLYFYWPGTLADSRDYKLILETLDLLIAKMHDSITRANIFTSDVHSKLHSSTTTSGVRLQKNLFINLKFEAAIIVAVVLFVILTGAGHEVGFIMIALSNAFILIYQLRKRQKLHRGLLSRTKNI